MKLDQKSSLPIDDFLPDIRKALLSHSSVVITAAPGAGKTTRVPPALMDITRKKIAVLEPRRIAALAAASRVCQELQSPLGERVGYEVRLDRKISSHTQLVFLTEALLMRKMLSDPSLSEFEIIVIDEFHERSLHTDLGLALLKELQLLERPDLKIVVMSATLEAKKISNYLAEAPIIDVPGKLHPLQIHYDSKPQSLIWSPDLGLRISEKIKIATSQSQKDCLVFLPGLFEIHQLERRLKEFRWSHDFEILPLHGRLDLASQSKALRAQGKRKIILATNVAESSVTIDGLDCVVDLGLERNSQFQMQSGFGKLTTRRISLASATQRAGRAARQFPGVCYKLWTPQDEKSFQDYAQPEIKTQDLSESLLFLSYLGVSDPTQFSWFETPPTASLSFALNKLKALKLLSQGRVTELGKSILKRPLSLRLSLLLHNFSTKGHPELGAWVAALLSEKTPSVSGSADEECDLIPLLKKAGQSQFEMTKKMALQLVPSSGKWTWSSSDESVLKEVLALSFADRLGRRRSEASKKGILSSGRGIEFHQDCSVKKSPYFIALDGMDTENSNETVMTKACGLSEEFLREKFPQEILPLKEIRWDDNKRTFLEANKNTLWGLQIGSEILQPARAEYVEEHLPRIAVEQFSWLCQENQDLGNWWSRYSYYCKNRFPDQPSFFHSERLLQVFEKACYGQKNLNSLASTDLVYHFRAELEKSDLEDFETNAPQYLAAAKGKTIFVHYEGENSPFVELKIQDAFVWKKTPLVCGHQKVTVVLLAPNMRPTQVTKDLEGFWKGSYLDIRKELKARYPKHDWPESI